LRVLKVLLDDLTINSSHRQSLKQLRNEVLVVLIDIARLYPAIIPGYLQANVLDSVSIFLTFEELQIKEPGLEKLTLVMVVWIWKRELLMYCKTDKFTRRLRVQKVADYSDCVACLQPTKLERLHTGNF
jgi:hypothetical protein